MLPSGQRNESKGEVDGSAQDVNSEADNQNDSSGEEDAGIHVCMYIVRVHVQYMCLYMHCILILSLSTCTILL